MAMPPILLADGSKLSHAAMHAAAGRFRGSPVVAMRGS